MAGIWVHPEYLVDHAFADRVNKLERALQQLRRDASYQEQRVAEQWDAMVEREFILTSDHITMLKQMQFLLFEGTDLASIGVSGKRPFGNSDWVLDIVEGLGWATASQVDDWDFPDDIVLRAQRLMAELPHALNALIARVPVEVTP